MCARIACMHNVPLRPRRVGRLIDHSQNLGVGERTQPGSQGLGLQHPRAGKRHSTGEALQSTRARCRSWSLTWRQVLTSQNRRASMPVLQGYARGDIPPAWSTPARPAPTGHIMRLCFPKRLWLSDPGKRANPEREPSCIPATASTGCLSPISPAQR